MAYVITAACIGHKEAACVQVCPVDAIIASDDSSQYLINPDDCIDCGACEPECPHSAIFAEDRVPANQRQFIMLNARYFNAGV